MNTFRSFTYLTKNRVLQTIAASTISIMPFSMIRAILVVIATLLAYLGYSDAFNWLNNMQLSMLAFMPLIINVLFSIHWAAKSDTSVVISIAVSLTALMMATGILVTEDTFFMHTSIPVSIGVSILTNLTIEKLANLTRELKNKYTYYTLIIAAPLLLVLGISLCVTELLPASFNEANEYIARLIYPDGYFHGLLYEVVRGLTWFLGVHGQLVFQDISLKLAEESANNIAQWHAGDAPLNILSPAFYDVWCASGGIGSTLSLLLCLIMKNSTQYKKLLSVSLPLSFFNINEPLIFGLPVILNPIMFIPFILTPMVNYSMAYAATAYGAVPAMQTFVGWATPPFINAWVASGGSMLSVVLQILLVVLGAVIYCPFFRVMERMSNLNLTDATMTIPTVDNIPQKTTLDISLISKNQHIDVINEMINARDRIKTLNKTGDFILFFQPQIRAFDKKIIAVEVLLRHKNHKGHIIPPYFLSYYETLGIMPELDFWVLEQAVTHIHEKLHQFTGMTLSVNISPQTITDPRLLTVIDKLFNKNLPLGWTLELEITESQKITHPERLENVISKIHEKGIKIALDDFGCGYSTLSYLLRYKLDKIKIDRTLVQGLALPCGVSFLKQVVNLCHTSCGNILIEGVETKEEYDECCNAGIDLIQGYLFYYPMPSERLSRILSTQHPLSPNTI